MRHAFRCLLSFGVLNCFPFGDDIIILQFCRLKFGFGGISASCETVAVREMSLYL